MRMVKLAIPMLCALLVIMSVSVACGQTNNPSSEHGIQITDQLGQTVTFNSTPQRIISLDPATTEILFALGLGDRVVGDTIYCDYPAAAQNVSKIGGFSTPNIEDIIALKPDVVFATQIDKAQVIPQLESLGITVVALNPETVNEIYDAIELVGNVTGTQKAAASLVESMRTSIDAVTSLVANLSDNERPSVFYITWGDPPMTAGGNTLQSQIIELAGGNNIFVNLSGYPTVHLETVLDSNPDIIIASTNMGSGADTPLAWAQNESSLQVTNAYKEGKIFGIDTDLTGRFGPRIVDAVEKLFSLIHPELAGQLK